MPVELDQLSEALDQSDGHFLLNLETGMVWPGQLLEYGEEPPNYDDDDPGSWESFSPLGSRAAFADMARFVATIEDPAIARRLEDALHGRGAFRRFRDALSRYPESFTAWQRFRDDAQLGRARAWLANAGYRPVNG